LYRNCSPILKFHLLIREATDTISTTNWKSKSVYSYVCDWLIRICDMTHLYWSRLLHMRAVAFTCVTWLIHMCAVTHSCVRHDSFTCVRLHSHAWHDLFICVTRLIHMCAVTPSHACRCIHICDTTHSHVWHDSFIRVTWLIHMRAMTHSIWIRLLHMCATTFMRVRRPICTWDMTHSCLRPDLLKCMIYVNTCIYKWYEWWLIHLRHYSITYHIKRLFDIMQSYIWMYVYMHI